MTIKTITANLKDFSRLYKEAKKLEKVGALPPDGKLTTLSQEQAQAILDKLKSTDSCNAQPSIYDGVVKQLLPDAKNYVLTKSFNDKLLRRDVPNLMDSFTPEELKSWAITTVATTTLPPYKFMKSVQKALEGGINAQEEAEARCTRHLGNIGLVQQATQEAIGQITYTNSLPSSHSPLQPSAPPTQTTYEKITYKLPTRPEVRTTPLAPLKQTELSKAPKPESSQVQVSKKDSPSWMNGIRGNIDISISPLKPKHVDLSANATLNNVSIGAGVDLSLKKPLSSRLVVNIPITASPIPLCVCVSGQLNRLHKMQFKLEIPLNPIDKLVSVIGIKCPPSLKIVSLKVNNVVKSIKKVFGRKKKHKKCRNEEVPVIKHKVSYVNNPEMVSPELKAACQKIADDLTQMDSATQKLSHEVNIAIQDVKGLQEELQELFNQQASLQENCDQVQNTLNVHKEQLSVLPDIQKQVIENQQQLNNLTSIVQANMSPDRITQLKNQLSPDAKAKMLAQLQSIANINT